MDRLKVITLQGVRKEYKGMRKAKGSIRSFFHREYERKQAIIALDFSVDKGEVIDCF